MLANNLFNATAGNQKFYLHNEMSIAATDSTAPTGTVTIAAGAALTATAAVTVNVPATDPGSGVSLVRLSNSPATTGGVLTTGTTFSYNAPIAWTLTGGDGGRRRCTRNGATPPATGPPSRATRSRSTRLRRPAPSRSTAAWRRPTPVNVTLTLTAADGAGSGVNSVLLSNSTDFSAATPIPYAASIPWTLTAGDGTKTVYVKFVDAVGNTSASPVSDTITLDTVGPNPGSVAIQSGASVTTTRSVSVTLSGVAGDATVGACRQYGDHGRLDLRQPHRVVPLDARGRRRRPTDRLRPMEGFRGQLVHGGIGQHHAQRGRTDRDGPRQRRGGLDQDHGRLPDLPEHRQ